MTLQDKIEKVKRRLEGHGYRDKTSKCGKYRQGTLLNTNRNPARTWRLLQRLAKLHDQHLQIVVEEQRRRTRKMGEDPHAAPA